jgi:hypothetical protein
MSFHAAHVIVLVGLGTHWGSPFAVIEAMDDLAARPRGERATLVPDEAVAGLFAPTRARGGR